MTQTANNYGTVLFELGITKEIVEKTKEIFELTSELPRVLNCPVVSRKEKHRMIERFFPQEIHHFLKELCDHEHMDVIEDVFAAYQNCYDEKNGILRAKMQCAEVPDETQLAQIKNGLGSNASHVKGYGIKINDNGTASLFAVIDKSLAAQKERIAKNAKTRAEEKKVAEKKADKKKTEEKQELKNDKSKKAEEKEDYVTVTASSVEELLKKINDTIYDSMSDHVKTPQEQLLGQHINFSA